MIQESCATTQAERTLMRQALTDGVPAGCRNRRAGTSAFRRVYAFVRVMGTPSVQHASRECTSNPLGSRNDTGDSASQTSCGNGMCTRANPGRTQSDPPHARRTHGGRSYGCWDRTPRHTGTQYVPRNSLVPSPPPRGKGDVSITSTRLSSRHQFPAPPISSFSQRSNEYLVLFT